MSAGFLLGGTGMVLQGPAMMWTILGLRAPGVTLMRMPVLAWAQLVTCLMVAAAVVPLTASLILELPPAGPASLPAASQLPRERTCPACTRISAHASRHVTSSGWQNWGRHAWMSGRIQRARICRMRDPDGNEFCVIDHSELGSCARWPV
jgi:hypothetical protein